jgi:hypothetical protein
LIDCLDDRFGEGFKLLGSAGIEQDTITHNLPARFSRL